MRNHTITEHLMLVTEVCAACGIAFAMPGYFVEYRRETGDTFYCPNGHSLSYGDTLKDWNRQLQNELAGEQRRREAAERAIERTEARLEMTKRQLAARKGQLTKLKSQVAKGMCPCCRRHFANLHRHMANQHPGFVAEGANEDA